MLKKHKIKAMLVGALLTIFTAYPAQAATYTVKSGDSLYKIGKLFNISYSTIMKDNNLSSNMIYPGQALNIQVKEYTVKAGDSLYLIAKANGVSLDALRNANSKWDNMIYPGQKLVIPGTSVQAPSASTTVTDPNKPILSKSGVSYTAADVNLLARLVTAEAENQPYSAKVGVAAVVLNRVKSSLFPNSIYSVIYEKSYGYYQFTPVQNGFINKAASQDAIKATYEALNGADPTKGAIYYFDDSATNQWLWSRPASTTIGKMIFKY